MGPISEIRFIITTPEGWQNALRWMVGQRQALGLTQADVAERMGTTQGEISKFERGLIDPRVSTVARYVRALELAPHLDAIDSATRQPLRRGSDRT